MKKSLLSLCVISLFSISLFAGANNSFKINKEFEEEGLQIITEFKSEPYKEEYQSAYLHLITKLNDYRSSPLLIDLIKEVAIYTNNQPIKEQALFLLEDDNFVGEEKVVDKNTGKEKIKKINTKLLEKKFDSIKEDLSHGQKHIVFLDKIGKTEEANKLFEDSLEISKTRVLSEEDTLYKIKYLLKKGNSEESLKTFNDFVNKFYEKKFSNGKQIVPVKEETKFIPGDIYTYGALLNYSNKELFDKYKQRAFYFYGKDTERFDFILGFELSQKELYEDASYFYENLREKNNDIMFSNLLLETFYKATRKNLLNNQVDSAWVNARKGLLLTSEVCKTEDNKRKYMGMLVEMKRYLKDSSLIYVKQLVEKGEHEHASRIKKETLELIAKKFS